MTNEVSSAIITVSSGDLSPVIASVVVAKLAPNVVPIASDEVLELRRPEGRKLLQLEDEGDISIQRLDAVIALSGTTINLQVGDIVLTGSKGGLMHRILEPGPYVDGDKVRVGCGLWISSLKYDMKPKSFEIYFRYSSNLSL